MPDRPAADREGTMDLSTSSSRSARSQILAHLRTLRASLAQARAALMHFKDDRVDRDQLEPAARRVDNLMDMFTSNLRDPAQSCLWVAEIQRGVEQVTNPKAADALRDARAEIAALVDIVASEGNGARGSSA
jgi:hypothetical protein